MGTRMCPRNGTVIIVLLLLYVHAHTADLMNVTLTSLSFAPPPPLGRFRSSEEYWGNVNPVGVRSCYDEGKRAAESLFFDYHRQNGVDIRVARIFNTYGPGMHPYDGRVVSNFIMQGLNGDPITIYGDGSQTRPSCVHELLCVSRAGIVAVFTAPCIDSLRQVHFVLLTILLTPVECLLWGAPLYSTISYMITQC